MSESKGPPEESKGPPEASKGPPEALKGPPKVSEGPSYKTTDLQITHNRFEMILCDFNVECRKFNNLMMQIYYSQGTATANG